MTPTATTQPVAPAAAGLARALAIVDRGSLAVIVCTMAAMATLVAAQVFFRYVLASSIDSADELSRLFFVWSIFLALPHGVRYGVHVGIDLLPDALPKTVARRLAQVVNAASCLLMLLVAYATFGVVVDKWSELMPTLPVTASLYFVPVLIGCLHTALHTALIAWAGPQIWQGDRL